MYGVTTSKDFFTTFISERAKTTSIRESLPSPKQPGGRRKTEEDVKAFGALVYLVGVLHSTSRQKLVGESFSSTDISAPWCHSFKGVFSPSFLRFLPELICILPIQISRTDSTSDFQSMFLPTTISGRPGFISKPFPFQGLSGLIFVLPFLASSFSLSLVSVLSSRFNPSRISHAVSQSPSSEIDSSSTEVI